MKAKKVQKFQTAIFKPFLFIIISLIIVCLSVEYISVERTFYTNELNKNIFALNSSAQNLQNSINSDLTTLESMSSNAEISYVLRNIVPNDTLSNIEHFDTLRELLKVYTFSQPEITNIMIFSPNLDNSSQFSNHLLPLSLLRDNEIFSPYTELYSAIITEGSPYMSLNAVSCDKSSVALMTRLQDGGDLLGILVISLSKDYLFGNCVGKSNDGALTAVVDCGKDAKNIICSDFVSSEHSSAILNSPAMQSSGYGMNKIKINGKNNYIISSSSNIHSWKTVSVISVHDFCHWRGFLLLANLLAFIVLSALTVFLTYFFTKRFTAPINSIIGTMDVNSKIILENNRILELEMLVNKYNVLLDNYDKVISDLKSESAKAKDAEIKALIAQMNPHFLNNALNSIGWAALDIGAENICKMISMLAQLCKFNYNFSDTRTLEQELIHVNLYMDLNLEYFNKDFTYRIDAPTETGKYIVPSFILQPLAENSIKHGFSQLKRNGEITVTVKIDDDMTITVSDNGSGIEKAVLDNLNSNSYHSDKYGIFNTNNRIKSICGDKYGLSFSSCSSLTTAKIVLPVIENPNYEAEKK